MQIIESQNKTEKLKTMATPSEVKIEGWVGSGDLFPCILYLWCLQSSVLCVCTLYYPPPKKMNTNFKSW